MKPDERYTWRACTDGYTDTGLRKGITEGDAICQLANYEDTGLSPGEVKDIMSERLPCAIGETWFVIEPDYSKVSDVTIVGIFLFEDKSESKIVAEPVKKTPGDIMLFSLNDLRRYSSKNRACLENLLVEMNKIRKNFEKLKEREDNA